MSQVESLEDRVVKVAENTRSAVQANEGAVFLRGVDADRGGISVELTSGIEGTAVSL